MKFCKKCSNKIPWRVEIDGKFHRTVSRTYCLTCSPFGSHNTRDPNERGNREITCKRCGKHYWYQRSDRKGATKTVCAACLANAKRTPKKIRAIALLGGACVVCKYARCERSLTFHHVDPAQKNFTIAQHMNRSWKAIEAELRKCVLLCMNCHGEVHAGVTLLQIPADRPTVKDPPSIGA
jgi:hypothetical protein